MPALFQVRNERDGQELLVDLCVIHLTAAPKAVKEMHTLRQQAPPHLLSQKDQGHE